MFTTIFEITKRVLEISFLITILSKNNIVEAIKKIIANSRYLILKRLIFEYKKINKTKIQESSTALDPVEKIENTTKKDNIQENLKFENKRIVNPGKRAIAK
jgi:hypothetical protein